MQNIQNDGNENIMLSSEENISTTSLLKEKQKNILYTLI